ICWRCLSDCQLLGPMHVGGPVPKRDPLPAPKSCRRHRTNSSNLPLSLLTGLADGLALKDCATRQTRRDSPQLVVPPISCHSFGRRFSGSARETVARPPALPPTIQAPRALFAKKPGEWPGIRHLCASFG